MVPYPVMIGFVNGLAIVIGLAQLEQFKIALVCQVEYFFSDDELCRNTFLRKHMDGSACFLFKRK